MLNVRDDVKIGDIVNVHVDSIPGLAGTCRAVVEDIWFYSEENTFLGKELTPEAHHYYYACRVDSSLSLPILPSDVIDLVN